MVDKKLLTIQDISCVGQCSLTVALPIISACGIETAILPGALLSNHTASGYSGWTFNDLTDEMPKILDQWLKEKIDFDAFYTGYVTKTQIPYIIDIMEKAAKPNAIRIVDPAMADNGVLYAGFDANFPQEMAKLCKGADYILPNLTEASFLLGIPYVGDNYDQAYIEKISRDLSKLGAKNVIITGVSFEKGKVGASVYYSETDSFEYYFNEWVNCSFHGTGDVFSSAFAGAILNGKTALEAITIAADFVVDSIKKTIDDKKDHWYGVKFEKAIPGLIKALGNY
ncbi:Pyridoxal/pyridoxine/pyridoxamine kinase [Neocallimastix lanati (nom. inval.)]|jgi:pyridoxine kinase|uniref:pyridoxal kinase n=1 Tax=Neocallimastix californiae TaxID=1754190 RepID=A0A1Y2FCP2_9FUNG|nr:Pyridoxal/pyridoxine/pyridoxamine kinase [Neocallimastix sp. JGI-2020a]ORY81698.1 Pyridoxal/pyridoxine/pyridoxamine kinase [Neocallimastix californiae]|eukprot:ORY81698.1 Pyridoxal/pyridoxine/pyridoxamine kinase [Neocallimastix californiae]